VGVRHVQLAVDGHFKFLSLLHPGWSGRPVFRESAGVALEWSNSRRFSASPPAPRSSRSPARRPRCGPDCLVLTGYGHTVSLRCCAGRERIDDGHAVVVLPRVQVFTVNRSTTHLLRRSQDGSVPVAHLKSLVKVDRSANQLGREFQYRVREPSLQQSGSIGAGQAKRAFGRCRVDKKLGCYLDRPSPALRQEKLLGTLALRRGGRIFVDRV